MFCQRATVYRSAVAVQTAASFAHLSCSQLAWAVAGKSSSSSSSSRDLGCEDCLGLNYTSFGSANSSAVMD
jgi:hypothetical protein